MHPQQAPLMNDNKIPTSWWGNIFLSLILAGCVSLVISVVFSSIEFGITALVMFASGKLIKDLTE